VVRALNGTTISEGSFEHLYRFRGGLIVRMDIQNVELADEPVGHRFTVENGLIRRMEVSSLPSSAY
jgi:hypothetical protein